MQTTLIRPWIIALALAASFMLPPADAALAEKQRSKGAKETKEERAERLEYSVKPRTAKTFEEAREHLDAERYAEAEAALGKLRLGRLSPHERALTHRLLGYTAYGREDNVKAIEHLEQALAEDGLPPADQADVLFQMAQIQAVERRWKDVIATLERWFQTVERPNSVGYYLMALSYYQLEDLDSALLPAKKAVQIAKTPQQPWLQLLLAIHLIQKDYAAATPVLVELIERYPNIGKGYWLQLSALYGVTGSNERALGVMDLAYKKGILTEDRDLRRLLQLMLVQGMPYRAAKILEKEMAEQHIQPDGDAFELLSSSWILARETPKAEASLERAAQLAATGDHYVRLAQVHLLQEEWEEAAAALRQALAKGGLDDTGTVQMLLGVAYYNEHDLEQARSWFARASQSGNTREQAQSWLEHIDREIGAKRSEVQTPG